MSERHEDGQVTVEQRGRVLLMGIDRHEKYNGFTPKMVEELTAAYQRLEDDPELWVGVLFAHGKHFTAGLDLPKFIPYMQEGKNPFSHGGVDVLALHQKSSKPIISAVHGICFTIGIELMLAGDIVIAATDCRFSQLEPKRCIMAYGGATVRFVQRCGWGNAMYHLLRADEFNAEEAYRIGLVQELVEPGKQLDRALEIAEEIAQNAPLAVQATKASSMKYIEEGEAAAIADFSNITARLAATEDAAEGLASFVERRPAVYKGK